MLQLVDEKEKGYNVIGY